MSDLRTPPNRLAAETSPYLLQHARNPVDWFPWGPEALARARALDRPILLSVAYSACHWCHAMEREPCEDVITAGHMNEHFVSERMRLTHSMSHYEHKKIPPETLWYYHADLVNSMSPPSYSNNTSSPRAYGTVGSAVGRPH